LRAALSLILALAFFGADASTKRSAAVRAEFVRSNPCPDPSAGKRCKGFVVDHVIPLCAGGADAIGNLQWQSQRDSYRKDAEERRLCKRIRAASQRQP
jgi:hypothetical protein